MGKPEQAGDGSFKIRTNSQVEGNNSLGLWFVVCGLEYFTRSNGCLACIEITLANLLKGAQFCLSTLNSASPSGYLSLLLCRVFTSVSNTRALFVGSAPNRPIAEAYSRLLEIPIQLEPFSRRHTIHNSASKISSLITPVGRKRKGRKERAVV